MHLGRSKRVTAAMTAMLVLVAAACNASQSPAEFQSEGESAGIEKTPRSAVEDKRFGLSVSLFRQNWEGRGISVQIDVSGDYEVKQLAYPEASLIRSGTLSDEDLRRIQSLLDDVEQSQFEAKYREPLPDSWGLWRYQLTIESSTSTGQANFHSEDEDVPENLTRIVEVILESTK